MESERLSCRAIAEIFGVALVVGIFVRNYPTQPGDWAGWVQAFGSIGALRVAIWVFERQRDADTKKAALAEIAQQRNFLLGVKAELSVNLQQYMSLVGRTVESQPTGVIAIQWPTPEKPFRVYESTAHLLGTLNDDDVRRRVITAYSLSSGLLETWNMHNELSRRYEELDEDDRTMRSVDSAKRKTSHYRILYRYSDVLRKYQTHAEEGLREAIDAIEGWEQRHVGL
ncbi:hypothetical protein CEG14_14975 [Bordetella genomosp. 1]|uniref:DUF4760 domain-containing protein n=1 Tax=Bordetella genomosp. 1 TaxID=1395607 RepID=A0A261SH91_9BORD|nr:hypothetical protein [Bordetella genomosp. 1]OZI36312.1 hypothetical protein CEG14_14975 [Bordetella genomosp. 1]